MGYYTKHKLEIKIKFSQLSEEEIYEKVVKKLKELDIMNYALDENFECYDACKWYEHEKHMRELSKEIPDVVFELYGEGEESGDLWKEYYINGKMQRCSAIITYDEYNENNLT